MAQKEGIRTFLAIELDEALKQEALSAVEALRKANPYFRFIPHENWHLTLHFFGALSLAEIEQVKEGLKNAVRNTVPFPIALKGFGVFPGGQSPRILWIGVEGNVDSLLQLKEVVDTAIHKLGFPSMMTAQRAGLRAEERKFHPHLTIARAREERTQAKIAFGPISFAGQVQQRVDRLTLFRSDLLAQGPKYTPLSVIFLKI